MAPGIQARLLVLVDREFRSLTETPIQSAAPQRFKARKINLAKLDSSSWDRKRGSVARLAGLLLSHDDTALAARVCESDQSMRTYASGIALLHREGALLRKTARLMDLASGRLSAVLERCEKKEAPAQV
jgi:hypothetical protein